MRKTVVIAVSALLMATLWTPSAQAGGDWVFGAAFAIGRIHFAIGFHSDYPDRYYYRTRVDVGRYYHGPLRCSRVCFQRGDYYYHGPSCPLVHAYFRDYGYRADAIFGRYAPRYGYPVYRDRGRIYGHLDVYRGYPDRGRPHRDVYRRDDRRDRRHDRRHDRHHGDRHHHGRGHHHH